MLQGFRSKHVSLDATEPYGQSVEKLLGGAAPLHKFSPLSTKDSAWNHGTAIDARQ
jgi:hypothetical protein